MSHANFRNSVVTTVCFQCDSPQNIILQIKANFVRRSLRGHLFSPICYPKNSTSIMHIKKQRLLTPGPTPLYPPALRAMMASDIHHRTEDFRNIYKSVLADLKEVMGTSNDVLLFAASGTGAMEASVSNLFSRGDKVIVCSAGKFGERWAEITKAYGLEVNVLKAEYGDVVTPERVEAALAAAPDTKGVFVQASETSTGAAHDVRAMAPRHRQNAGHFRRRRHHRPRHHAARYRRLGSRRRHRRLAESFHGAARRGVSLHQPESLEAVRNRHAAALLFRFQEGKEERRQRRIELDAVHGDHSRARRSAAHTSSRWAWRT